VIGREVLASRRANHSEDQAKGDQQHSKETLPGQFPHNHSAVFVGISINQMRGTNDEVF
jgi:hypothetical protein